MGNLPTLLDKLQHLSFSVFNHTTEVLKEATSDVINQKYDDVYSAEFIAGLADYAALLDHAVKDLKVSYAALLNASTARRGSSLKAELMSVPVSDFCVCSECVLHQKDILEQTNNIIIKAGGQIKK